MSPEATPMVSVVSLVGSAATAAATAYMWLTRFRKERPNLQLYPAAAHTGIELGVLRGETRFLHFKFGAVVANYSSLPNAVIDVAVDLRRPDRSWQEVEKPRATAALPLNVTSMTTALLTLEWVLPLQAVAEAEAVDGPGAIVAGYLAHYFTAPAAARLTVLALGDREFAAVLSIVPPR